ncbi:MAG: GNAT family N-acetyltransferase, partial [Clostridiales bacterium]|nr:GNAT family N-acetyltransferase [Clostridiales bacterium]
MVTRLAEINDLPAWKNVAANIAEIFGNPGMADDPKFIDYAERKIEQREAIAAVGGETGECVGFIGFSRNFNRITWFGVLEKFRGNGIGDKLFQLALSKLDSSKEITVETFRDNYMPGLPARRLYLKHGFSETENNLFDSLG